jgi:hypothetical protein
MNRRVRYAIYKALPSIVALAIMAAAFYWYRAWNDPIRRGQDVNRAAWEATFCERGEAIPESGPRDGYGGTRLRHNKSHPDHAVRWIVKEASVPGLFEIDDNGEQHWIASHGDKKTRIAIVGASVAWGGYASCIERTYFAVAGRELEARGVPVEMDIVATGGWKSSQELAALRWYLKRQSPRLIIDLSGLNDLTLGATVSCLMDEVVRLPDGTLAEHLPDYEPRARAYLFNIEQMAGLAENAGAKFLAVLQPSLLEKSRLTPIEEKVARYTVGTLASGEQIPFFYDLMRRELEARQRFGKLHWFDASRLFDSESATTFSDIWHFADRGHELLGKALATQIAGLLAEASNRSEKS